MRKISQVVLMALIVIGCTNSLIAQNNFFTDAGQNTHQQTTGKRVITPENYRAAKLNIQGMKIFCGHSPQRRILPTGSKLRC